MINLKYTFYEIISLDKNIDFLYIGSTNEYKNRIRQHKNSCINPRAIKYNEPLYLFLRQNGGWLNFQFNVIEIMECNSKYDVVIREKYLIDIKDAKFNKQVIKCKQQNYYQNNKEIIKKKQKIYYDNKNKQILN